MVFVYIIISAVLLYFVIRYGIRDGLIETEASKDKLVNLQKSNDLFGEISAIYFNLSKRRDKEDLEAARRIYDDSFDMILSGDDPKHVFAVLTKNKEEIAILHNQE